MSIWCSTQTVACFDYGHSGIYPWETTMRESDSYLDFAYVADYVYDPDAMGEKVMPYLRLGMVTPKGFDTVVLSEQGARLMVAELTKWLDHPKRNPRRGKRRGK